jgi:DNA-binding NarL/FixJ family response regulator
MPLSILVVDDFKSFLEFVTEMLGAQPELQVIGQAVDGLDAIQKARTLQPDVILLDIGLPELNGLEAARHIRIVSPSSKLIFVSQESSADILEESMRLGHGYVAKVDVRTKLLGAIDKVLRGEPFLTANLP